MQKYACCYDNTEFTDAEKAEIGTFAAEVTKLAVADDEAGLVELLKREFGGIDEETFSRINRFTEYISTFDKEAQGMQMAAKIMAPLAIALAATPLLGHAMSAITTRFTHRAALKKAIELHPELKDDPNVPMYFQAIASFAPKIAENALMVGNLLAQMHRIGPSAMTPQLLSDLIGMQAKVKPGAAEKAQPLSESMMEFAKAFTPKH